MYISIMWSRRSPHKKIKTCSIFLVLSSSLFSFHMICLCCILFILPVYYIHEFHIRFKYLLYMKFKKRRRNLFIRNLKDVFAKFNY